MVAVAQTTAMISDRMCLYTTVIGTSVCDNVSDSSSWTSSRRDQCSRNRGGGNADGVLIRSRSSGGVGGGGAVWGNGGCNAGLE